jgi:hypothetical protein
MLHTHLHCHQLVLVVGLHHVEPLQEMGYHVLHPPDPLLQRQVRAPHCLFFWGGGGGVVGGGGGGCGGGGGL